MPWRFRKSVKILPGVRVNFSKRGVGYSVGGRGFRYTIGADGRRTRTFSIPGTGLSHVTTERPTRALPPTSKPPYGPLAYAPPGYGCPACGRPRAPRRPSCLYCGWSYDTPYPVPLAQAQAVEARRVNRQTGLILAGFAALVLLLCGVAILAPLLGAWLGR